MLLDPTFVAIQVLNGLQLSMLLFLLAVGLSVVFGLMNFVNLAHGALYALGAYLGLSCVRLTGSVWLAFALAPLGVTLIGVALYATLLRRLVSESPMTQILATFGLMLVAVDAVRMAWGNLEHSLPSPAGLTGSVEILGQAYPVYRLFIIALGGLIMAALYVGLERTRFGAIIRAGVDNRVMAASLGIDVGRAFFWAFCLGSFLAGLAGVVAGAVLPMAPGMGLDILILTLVVVVVGGPGSLKGTVLGSLLIGMAATFGQVLAPQYASITLYAVMALVLVVRPQGLMPARGRS